MGASVDLDGMRSSRLIQKVAGTKSKISRLKIILFSMEEFYQRMSKLIKKLQN